MAIDSIDAKLDGLNELQEFPQIRDIQGLVLKNLILAKIIGSQHTTQSFSTAEDLALAFQAQLMAVDPVTVKGEVDEAMHKFAEIIRGTGITKENLKEVFEKVWIYSRLTNPTNELLEDVISKIEGAEKTAVFASGLAAIDAAVRQFVKPGHFDGEKYSQGGKIVVIGSIYGGTYAQLMDTCEETGRQFEHMPISEFKKRGLPRDTDLVLCETCNNPTLRVVPLGLVAEESKTVGAISCVDNTFTPMSVRPVEDGIDLTITSMTKYFNGQSEDLGGSVSGSEDMINRFLGLHDGRRMLGGANMAPRVAKEFLLHLLDLPERLHSATQNARKLKAVAEQLGIRVRTVEDYPEYDEIRNPEMPDSITNGMVALFMKDSDEATKLVNALIQEGIGACAVSLGCKRTYYSIPSQTTHSEMPEDEMRKIGITPGLVRVSCGLEPDLVERFKKVLESM